LIEATATGGTTPYQYQLLKNGVLHTPYQSLASAFLVEIGNTFTVQVKDAKGCTTEASITINPVLPVVATLSETTCYDDPTASVNVSATGEPGRTFEVRYRINTGSYGAWLPLNAENERAIGGLVFANVIEEDNFYYFQLRDSEGCMTEEIRHSFVPTQHPLQIITSPLAANGLTSTITVTGGISPYTVQIGTMTPTTLAVSGDSYQTVPLPAGTNTVTVTDAHGCAEVTTLTVIPVSVVAVPASGNNQPNTFTVALTFNRDVTGVASSTTVTGGTGTATVTGSGAVYTVAITGADNANITLALSNGIMDIAGNTLSATSFPYTIGDHVAPTVIVTPPAPPVATTFVVGLTFSEPVSGVVTGTGVTVSGGTGVITGSGATYSLTVTAPEKTAVSIVLTNMIKDVSLNANAFAGTTVSYTTGDFTPPALASTVPTNAATISDNHPKPLSFTLSENVQLTAAGGTLKITKVGTTTPSVTVTLTAAMIQGSVVSVTYVAATNGGLDKNTDYFVTVDAGAIEDLAGNDFAGVTATTTWTFKTGTFATPVIDPVNNSLKVYPNPFVDYVIVSNASELSKVIVTNIVGQKVKEVVKPTDRIQLDGLRSGVYFITLYKENTVINTTKLIKK